VDVTILNYLTSNLSLSKLTIYLSKIGTIMAKTELYPLIWKVRRVFQQLRRVSDTILEDLGINASQRAVLELLCGEEQLSVPQIARQLSVTRQHVQVLVNELQAKSLVESVENPAHKRSPLIGTTEAGRGLFAAIAAREQSLLDALQSSFSSQDIAISLSTLKTLEECLVSRDWEKK
jgi:DNA-binding MarR family transcriptional regulator